MVNAVSGEEYVHIDCDKPRCYDWNLLRYQKWGTELLPSQIRNRKTRYSWFQTHSFFSYTYGVGKKTKPKNPPEAGVLRLR